MKQVWFAGLLLLLLVACDNGTPSQDQAETHVSATQHHSLLTEAQPPVFSSSSSIPHKAILAPPLPQEISAASPERQRQLARDWNLVALPVEETLPVTTFLNSDTKYQAIKSIWKWDTSLGAGGSWRVYPRTGTYPLLTHVNPQDGYWVRLTSAIEFQGSGRFNHTFVTGWNLIGYSYLEPAQTVQTFFNQWNFWASACRTGQAVQSVWAWDANTWKIYFPNDADRVALNQQNGTNYPALTTLQPGMGLWVRAAWASQKPSSGACESPSTPPTTSTVGGITVESIPQTTRETLGEISTVVGNAKNSDQDIRNYLKNHPLTQVIAEDESMLQYQVDNVQINYLTNVNLGLRSVSVAPRAPDGMLANQTQIIVKEPSLAAEARSILDGDKRVITLPTEKKAIILRPMHSQEGFGSREYDLVTALRNGGFKAENITVLNDSDVTLNVMRTLYQYDFIYIQTHGSTNGGLVMGESACIGNVPLLSRLCWKPQTPGQGINVYGFHGTPILYYGVDPAFYASLAGNFNESFFYIQACSSLGSGSSLATALQSKGVRVVSGWNRLSDTEWHKILDRDFVSRILTLNLPAETYESVLRSSYQTQSGQFASQRVGGITTMGDLQQAWKTSYFSFSPSSDDYLLNADISSASLNTSYQSSVSSGQWRYYKFSGATASGAVRVTLNGLSGNADLYVRSEAMPFENYACGSSQSGTTNEQCDIESPGSASWYLGVYGRESASFTLQLALKAIGYVSGRVQDATDNTFLAGVSVAVYQNSSLVSSTSSDSNGSYSLSLPPGTGYQIVLSKSGYLSESYSNVSISKDLTTYLETVLSVRESSSNGTVSGQITNAVTGQGESGVSLSFRRGLSISSGSVVSSTTTGSGGSYSLSLAPGNYTAQLSKSGFKDSFITVVSVGGVTKSNQSGSINPTMPTGQIRIVLNWGSSPSDLDAHLTGPISGSSSRFHIYYSNKTPSGVTANLDVDDTSSYGPETVTITSVLSGTYRYSVHDYSNSGSSSSTALSNSGARVSVVTESGTQTFYVPSGGGTLWTVLEIQNGVIAPYNTMSYQSSSSSVPRQVEGGTDSDVIFSSLEKQQ